MALFVTIRRAAPHDAYVVDNSHPELRQGRAEASGELIARAGGGGAYRRWDGDLIGRGEYVQGVIGNPACAGMTCALTVIGTDGNVEWAL